MEFLFSKPNGVKLDDTATQGTEQRCGWCTVKCKDRMLTFSTCSLVKSYTLAPLLLIGQSSLVLLWEGRARLLYWPIPDYRSTTLLIVNDFMNNTNVLGWFSGGVTSAVACKLAKELFGRIAIVSINTYNEDDDSYRFMKDCEKWYGQEIDVISNKNYENIEEVWRKFNALNNAHGAICSSELKRRVRELYQKDKNFTHQVFGFDIDEPKRAKAMRLNYPTINPIFPLLMFGYTKKKCMELLGEAGIEIPKMYNLGFTNNNCFKTGCVQGGIGYWQKMMREFPEKFDKMAAMEHELTDKKGQPVTMLKDQSKKTGGLVFLKPHPDYPLHKDITMMKGKYVEPLVECNGFCGTNDLITQ